MRYALLERVLDSNHELPLTKEEFDAHARSSKLILEMLFIEEKYFLLLQNYYELERTFNDLALQDMLFRDYDWSERANDINTVNRCVMNLLSATKMYIDHVPQHLKAIFAPNEEECATFQSMTSAEYDSSFAYRVISALRNHAQHGDFPVHSLSFDMGLPKDAKTRQFRHAVTGFLHVDSLAQNKKFKATVLAELKAIGDKIDLKPLFRQYISSFARLHVWVREVSRPTISECERLVQCGHDGFRQSVNREPVALAAVAINTSGEHEKVHDVFLDGIKRKEHLERRSTVILNLDQCFVSGDTQ